MSNKTNVIENVENLIKPFLEKLELNLVDVEYLQDGGFWYLRIYIENKEEDKPITLEDCAELSHLIDEEVDKLIPEKFFLEVSSPGVERALKKIPDFVRFTGEQIKVALVHKLKDNKNYTGKLVGVKDENIILLDISSEVLEIPFKEIRKANIVFDFSSLD